jgi:multidrug efflux pump subunit AcrA (membrane-fusion protein)
LIGVGAALVLVIIVSVTVYQSRKNLVTVQTGKVQKQNLTSVVSASGEIKPKTYANIGANALGKIVKLHVKEGDRVKKGQLLAQLENVQSSADVNATRASVQAAQTDAVAADAALNTSLADLNRANPMPSTPSSTGTAPRVSTTPPSLPSRITTSRKRRGRPPMPAWRKPKPRSPKPERKRIRWTSTSPRIRPT